LIAALTLLAGLLVVAWGVERWLSSLLGPISSLFLVGGLLLLVATGLALWVRRLIRR
jgi:high-affinity Fe2+/Pb2+ permease